MTYEAKLFNSPMTHGVHQKVVHLGTEEEICFSGTLTAPKYMLVYGKCAELGMLPEFFKACMNGRVDAFIAQFNSKIQVSDSGRTMSLDDWCVLLQTD